MEDRRQTIPVIGRLVALQSGVVSSRIAGPVSEVNVEVGDRVEEGDVLVALDQARIHALRNQRRLEIDQYLARSEAAMAREKLARLELKRLERLRNTAAFAESVYDTRVQELAVATHSLREAEALIERARYAYEMAEIDLRDSVVRAPFPGVVTARHASEGAWLRVGDTVAVLVNERRLEIEADVPADRAAVLRSNDAVGILFADGQSTQGVVRAIVPDENPAARTRPVRIRADLDAPETTLAANQAVRVLVPAGAAVQVVSVHKDAILRRGDTTTVFVVADGIATPRPVLLGDAVEGRFQVLEGLNHGDLVVIRGNERLRPGQSVIFEERRPRETSVSVEPST